MHTHILIQKIIDYYFFHLEHDVEENKSDDERISIAFNINVSK